MDEKTVTVYLRDQTDLLFQGVVHNAVNYSEKHEYEILTSCLRKKNSYKKSLKISLGKQTINFNSSNRN